MRDLCLGEPNIWVCVCVCLRMLGVRDADRQCGVLLVFHNDLSPATCRAHPRHIKVMSGDLPERVYFHLYLTVLLSMPPASAINLRKLASHARLHSAAAADSAALCFSSQSCASCFAASRNMGVCHRLKHGGVRNSSRTTGVCRTVVASAVMFC